MFSAYKLNCRQAKPSQARTPSEIQYCLCLLGLHPSLPVAGTTLVTPQEVQAIKILEASIAVGPGNIQIRSAAPHPVKFV